MRRRDFIMLVGGAAAAWPLAVRAQQPERMQRIGILLPAAADHSEYQARVGVFVQGLAQSGWTIGRKFTPILHRRSRASFSWGIAPSTTNQEPACRRLPF